MWEVELGDGSTLRARYLVTATGFLSQPKMPDIPGVEDFAGKVTFINPAAEVLIGSKAQAVIGKSGDDVLRLVEQRLPDAKGTPLAALRVQQSVDLEGTSRPGLSASEQSSINEGSGAAVA